MSQKEINNILSSWIALEILLSSQVVEDERDLAPDKNSKLVINLTERMPWKEKNLSKDPEAQEEKKDNNEKILPKGPEAREEKKDNNEKIFYQVILGTMKHQDAIKKLFQHFDDEDIEKLGIKEKHQSIMAAAVLDKEGSIIDVTVSSFAWAFTNARQQKFEQLSDWPAAQEAIEAQLTDILYRVDAQGNVIPCTRDMFIDAFQFLREELKLDEDFTISPKHIIKQHKKFLPQLNSFFLEDLCKAKELNKVGKLPESIKRYLGQMHHNIRHDILKEKDILEQVLAPKNIPTGCWANKSEYSLALLQQAAINLALNDLQEGEILAINGPPGTGKTVLLSDVIAGLVSERAYKMCNFDNPEDAFTEFKIAEQNISIYKIDKSLKGYEMLVASANNNSVENISKELPNINAIGKEFGDFRYFDWISNKLVKDTTWGLIAAALGKNENLQNFKGAFGCDNKGKSSEFLTDLEEIFRKNPVETVKAWKESKEEYKKLYEDTKSRLQELEGVRKGLPKLKELEGRRQKALNELEEIGNNRQQLVKIFEKSSEKKAAAEVLLKKAQENLKFSKENKPKLIYRLLHALFGREDVKKWQESHLLYQEKHTKYLKEDFEISEEYDAIKKELSIVEKKFGKQEKIFESIDKEYESFSKKINKVIDELGKNIIDENFFDKPHKELHQINPWLNAKVQYLRKRVFVGAMSLQEQFITAAAIPFKENLSIFFKEDFAKKSTFEDNAVIADLWASLFMIVPCISTTFASVGRMLKKLPPESLGWLLIDEGGQAAPQAAVGAIMRAKKTLVLGDSLQIKPIVDLHEYIISKVFSKFEVDANKYHPQDCPVQILADAASKYYTYIKTSTGKKNVGIPLLVHRRCSEPMFSISNKISYGGLMINAKKIVSQNDNDIANCLGKSKWIHVEDVSSNIITTTPNNSKGKKEKKWSKKEGEVLLQLLQQLKNKKIVEPDIYILSPFKDVKEGVKNLIERKLILNHWIKDYKKWISNRVDTVYSSQGREADTVIFMLGAQEVYKSRYGMGKESNVLNVAVTRAKENIYIIGNKTLWSKEGVFNDLAEKLPIDDSYNTSKKAT